MYEIEDSFVFLSIDCPEQKQIKHKKMATLNAIKDLMTQTNTQILDHKLSADQRREWVDIIRRLGEVGVRFNRITTSIVLEEVAFNNVEFNTILTTTHLDIMSSLNNSEEEDKQKFAQHLANVWNNYSNEFSDYLTLNCMTINVLTPNPQITGTLNINN